MTAACLLVGHLLLTEYMPNAAVGAVGLMLLFALVGYVVLVRHDLFAFVMLIYVCSHFAYADNQGGLWSLAAAVMALAYMVLGLPRERRPGGERLLGALVGVLLLWNAMGWVARNPVGLMERLQGAFALIGMLLMYRLSSELVVTNTRIRTFVIITGVMVGYELFVALNQRYAIVNWNTPLLGAYSKGVGFITYGSTNAQGTLRHSELLGEYGALIWCLMLPLLCSSKVQKQIRLGTWLIVVLMLACLALIMLTSTRSAVVLLALGFVGFYLAMLMRPIAAIDRFARQAQLGIVAAVVLTLFGTQIGMGSLEQDYTEISSQELSLDRIVSGEALNRGGLFPAAVKRIEGESWAIGFGWGTLRSNKWAWFDKDPNKFDIRIADYHNLYLSLPMLFGWVGSLAFVLIVLLTWVRVVRAAARHRGVVDLLVVLAMGFSLFWPLFLLDQYKISVLRNPGYFMMLWIWLGMSVAVARTLDARAGAASLANGNAAINASITRHHP